MAHNPNEAFFTISTNSNYTEIIAELPWSVRNDLILFYPELEKTKDDQDYVKAFKKYIQQKLILRNQSGDQIPLISVEEESHNGHSHQNNFRITYKGSRFFEIENTILFSSYENQKNHHFLTKGNEKLTYITRLDVPSFAISDANSEQVSRSKYWLIIALIIISLLGTFYLKRNLHTK